MAWDGEGRVDRRRAAAAAIGILIFVDSQGEEQKVGV